VLLTKASEYGLLSLVVIAGSDKPLDADTVSKQLNISKSFLAKILQSFARNGILKSYKGANGGFVLAKNMEEITIYEVIEIAEKKRATVFECSVSSSECPSNKASFCSIWPILTKLQYKIDLFLQNPTLKDLVE